MSQATADNFKCWVFHPLKVKNINCWCFVLCNLSVESHWGEKKLKVKVYRNVKNQKTKQKMWKFVSWNNRKHEKLQLET